MSLSDEQMSAAEAMIPVLGVKALEIAQANAMKSGFKVVFEQNGELVEKLPDGTRRVLKKLPPRLEVDTQKVYRLL